MESVRFAFALSFLIQDVTNKDRRLNFALALGIIFVASYSYGKQRRTKTRSQEAEEKEKRLKERPTNTAPCSTTMPAA
jgi:hypothetical protein